MVTLSQCLALLDSPDWSESTRKYYRRNTKSFAAHWEEMTQETFDLVQVTSRDLRNYRDYLQGERRLRVGTIEKKFAPLRFAFKQALRKRWIETNPMEGIKRLKQSQAVPRSLSKIELAALMRTIQKELENALRHHPVRWRTYRRDASLVIFLLNTGVRVQEACDVRLDDIRLSERKGSLLVRKGKGRKERRVPLNTHARQALQEWLAVRPDSETTHLWTTVEQGSNPLSKRSVQRILARYKELAGLERLSPHICRHSFSKHLVDEKVSLEKVAKLLGHENLNTTKIYIAPSDEDLAQAVEAL